jgi:UPF0716 protein FxsA
MRILGYLLLAFILIPAVELVLLFGLVQVTDNWLLALGLIVLTGMIGAALARQQGWEAWAKIKRSLAQGELPGNEIVGGFLILIAGALLITPGIMTDVVGFLLLIPGSRNWMSQRLVNRFKKKLKVSTPMGFPGMGTMPPGFGQPPPAAGPAVDSDVIDVEAETVIDADVDSSA